MILMVCFRMVTDSDYLEKKMPMINLSLLKVSQHKEKYIVIISVLFLF